MRKALSKKTRFDVFKRDGFICQYCGQTPPTVVLEVDHINPVSNGGEDSVDNLTTSCFDCNRGKSGGLLTDLPKTVASKAEALKEKETQLSEYGKLLKNKRSRETRDIGKIEKVFQMYFPNRKFTETFKGSIRSNFLPYLAIDELELAMEKASSYINDPARAIKYFCGICWKKRKGE